MNSASVRVRRQSRSACGAICSTSAPIQESVGTDGVVMFSERVPLPDGASMVILVLRVGVEGLAVHLDERCVRVRAVAARCKRVVVECAHSVPDILTVNTEPITSCARSR